MSIESIDHAIRSLELVALDLGRISGCEATDGLIADCEEHRKQMKLKLIQARYMLNVARIAPGEIMLNAASVPVDATPEITPEKPPSENAMARWRRKQRLCERVAWTIAIISAISIISCAHYAFTHLK